MKVIRCRDEYSHTHAFVSSISSDSDASDLDSGTFMLLFLIHRHVCKFFSRWCTVGFLL